MLSRTKTPIPPNPKVGDIIYTTNTDNPQTGDIRELLMFNDSKRDWVQLYEVWNGLWWVRCISLRAARGMSNRFKENGGSNG